MDKKQTDNTAEAILLQTAKLNVAKKQGFSSWDDYVVFMQSTKVKLPAALILVDLVAEEYRSIGEREKEEEITSAKNLHGENIFEERDRMRTELNNLKAHAGGKIRELHEAKEEIAKLKEENEEYKSVLFAELNDGSGGETKSNVSSLDERHPLLEFGFNPLAELTYEEWERMSKHTPPQDNTKQNVAWKGAWLEGEMTGYAKCMIDKVLKK